jgi:peptidoglycan/LPS O-acetylase OafA/YrhL
VSGTLPIESRAPLAVSGRLRSLDGLRGIAALIVVLHHCMLTWAPMAGTYRSGATGARPFSVLWWLTQTPFKLLTAGTESVIIFFVLSGVVLALPVLGKRSFDWWGYYPRRMVRLYVPAVAAVAFAAVISWFLPAGSNKHGDSWIAQSTVPHAPASLVLAAADLMSGNPAIDPPLWSLRWEVLFSLLLPAIIGLAVLGRGRRGAIILVVAAVVLIVLGVRLGDPALSYLPVFVVGAAIAVGLPDLRRAAERLSASRLSGIWWTLILIGALLAIINSWLLRPVIGSTTNSSAIGAAVTMAGAAVLVITAAFWRPVSRFLETRVVQWLGRISFSVYLIHVPILLAFNAVLGPELWFVSAACTVAVALGGAELFARFIEQPAHRLSQRTGRVFSARVRSFLGAEPDA